MHRWRTEQINIYLRKCLCAEGKSENAFLTPPFFCDYGSHIEVGKNFSTNYNCTIPDMNMGKKLRLEIMYGSVEVQ